MRPLACPRAVAVVPFAYAMFPSVSAGLTVYEILPVVVVPPPDAPLGFVDVTAVVPAAFGAATVAVRLGIEDTCTDEAFGTPYPKELRIFHIGIH